MIDKLNRMYIAAYAKGYSFVHGLKNDERGLSGVVVAVLLILIAVFAVVFLWDGLSAMLSDMWTKITGDQGTGGIAPI